MYEHKKIHLFIFHFCLYYSIDDIGHGRLLVSSNEVRKICDPLCAHSSKQVSKKLIVALLIWVKINRNMQWLDQSTDTSGHQRRTWIIVTRRERMRQPIFAFSCSSSLLKNHTCWFSFSASVLKSTRFIANMHSNQDGHIPVLPRDWSLHDSRYLHARGDISYKRRRESRCRLQRKCKSAFTAAIVSV